MFCISIRVLQNMMWSMESNDNMKKQTIVVTIKKINTRKRRYANYARLSLNGILQTTYVI